MTKPRVLLLNENRGFGGAERHVVSLARELSRIGALVGVVARKDSWLSNHIPDDIPVFPCGFRNEIDMFSAFAIYRLIKATGANILHCVAHRDLVAAALARQLPSLPPTQLIKAEHSFPDQDLSPLFRWSYRQCTGIVSVSSAAQHAIIEKLSPKLLGSTATVVIANGVAMGADPAPNPPQHPARLGVLSALREGKGHRDVIQAFAAYPEHLDQFKLSFAGDGPLLTELQSLAHTLAVPIDFLGHIDNPQRYLQDLDLCLLPSHTETFSLVALECLCQSIPLVAADSLGVQELYPQPDRLYPRGDTLALSALLKRYTDNPVAFMELATKLAPQYRHQYSDESMARHYFEFYQTLLSNPDLATF